jgi:acyl-CoA synthetase (NDP forming)
VTVKALPRVDLERLCAPRSVAIIGASDDDRKFGGRAMKYLLKHGFRGAIFPINPRKSAVLGVPAFETVSAVGQPVDVAIMALPVERLEACMADCAAAGVKFAVVITSKFAEVGGEGVERQERILEIARSAGMRILGPNCLGFIVPGNQLALSPSVSMERDDLPGGRIGLVSQSGALMATMYDFGADRGIGFSLCVSVGNQADLEICDFIDFMIDDPNTKVITAYVEGLIDPGRFLDCARCAHAAGKPLLVTKAGRSEAGAAAARSHTASLAGTYSTFAAACRSAGITLFDDPNSMVEAADFLTRAERYHGGGAAVVSGSGGGCAIMLDRLAEIGFERADLSSDTLAALDGVLPEANRCLPVDLGVLKTGWTRAGIAAVFDRALADPSTGVGICVLTTQPVMLETVEEAVRAARHTSKPLVIATLAGRAAEEAREACRRLGHPYFDTIDAAIRALATMSEYASATIAAPSSPRTFALPQALESWTGALSEHEAKTLVECAGIRVTREVLATNAEAAMSAAEEIGYPVVMKGVSKAVVHKSDIGAVKLDLKDAKSVREAFESIEAAFASHRVGGFEGCLVQEMGHGEIELFLGAKCDPEFGSLILLGIGGTTVELLGDVQTALAPITSDHALGMMRRMKLWPLLDGYRGRKKVDVEAAARAASNLSHLAATLGSRLVEMDINPLLVGERGNGVIAVDGRATLAGRS